MENQNNFAAQVAASEKAQKHAQEIQQSRVGGLGGSDAALVFKIGLNGMASLTATDHKRLAVMLGKTEPDNWAGNAFTNAGHLFEDWAEKCLPWGACGYNREKVLSAPLAKNFKVFAHADFVTGEMHDAVIECKFVQGATEIVIDKYYAQLQWYYMLGVHTVTLYHGKGTAEPFEVKEAVLEPVQRDETAIKVLLNGIKILDKALSEGWLPEVADKVTTDDVPEIVAQAFETMQSIKEQQKALADEEKEAKKTLLEYVEGFGITGIVATDGSKHQIIYTKPSIAKTFDVAAFAEAHPEIDLTPFYKETKRAASITFK